MTNRVSVVTDFFYYLTEVDYRAKRLIKVVPEEHLSDFKAVTLSCNAIVHAVFTSLNSGKEVDDQMLAVQFIMAFDRCSELAKINVPYKHDVVKETFKQITSLNGEVKSLMSDVKQVLKGNEERFGTTIPLRKERRKSLADAGKLRTESIGPLAQMFAPGPQLETFIGDALLINLTYFANACTISLKGCVEPEMQRLDDEVVQTKLEIEKFDKLVEDTIASGFTAHESMAPAMRESHVNANERAKEEQLEFKTVTRKFRKTGFAIVEKTKAIFSRIVEGPKTLSRDSDLAKEIGLIIGLGNNLLQCKIPEDNQSLKTKFEHEFSEIKTLLATITEFIKTEGIPIKTDQSLTRLTSRRSSLADGAPLLPSNPTSETTIFE